jgi:hypothetical protein
VTEYVPYQRTQPNNCNRGNGGKRLVNGQGILGFGILIGDVVAGKKVQTICVQHVSKNIVTNDLA